MTHLIRVNEETYERLRKLVFEQHQSFGKVIDVLLDEYTAGPIIFEVSRVTDDGADEDPRSAAEREQDEAAADWAGQTADLRGGL